MRPIVLSIAGFDPSGGAGILADTKTFEQHKVLGLGVNSCNTIQTEDEFISLNWIDRKHIIDQIVALQGKYKLEYVKIGLIQSLEMLAEIIDVLKTKNKEITIIWDPVLKSSSGFSFHNELDKTMLKAVLSKISILTPNLPEYAVIVDALGNCPSRVCSVLLKGGHSAEAKGVDLLMDNNQEMIFDSRASDFSKHGTGCVLSSAILSNLANGNDIIKSVKLAKEYIFSFIESNETLLGYHSRGDEK